MSIITSATPLELGRALAASPAIVVGAALEARPPSGAPTGVATGIMSGFPQSGPDFAILTSGSATLAATANSSSGGGANNRGGSVRGNTDRDVVVLRVDLDVPATANCLVGLDFRFLSEEFPEFVGSSFNDAFVVELDRSTWTTRGSTITAPDNFAFDPAGQPITINAAGATSMSTAEAAGTTYDGAPPLLTAATPITPGPHRLYLSIFDQGDNAYDSAVFVDNLRFGRVANVAEDCGPGAQVLDPDQARPLIGAHGITGVLEDMEYSLGLAVDLIPTLPVPSSADTGRITSVWENGAQIRREAREVLRTTPGADRVNLIAHSKGGLDSRVAMWEDPTAFASLGMLATPNGGSRGADKICLLRRVGSNFMAGFGPCDDDTDGLFNLQTGYMRDVFNRVVRDWSQHAHFVAAGDCTGFGRIRCNAATTNLLDCADGDTAVCVESAFDQSIFDGRGQHFPLDPVFDADHTQMRNTA